MLVDARGPAPDGILRAPAGAIEGNPAVQTIVRSIVQAVAAQAREDLRKSREDDAKRPVGEKAIDIDLYSDAERRKPTANTRWVVKLVRWNGSEWKTSRRLSGPLPYDDALKRRGEECRRRNLNQVRI